LFRLPNIFKLIKFRILRWAEHVASMEEGRPNNAFKLNLDERDL
jgi:hypothetical protein